MIELAISASTMGGIILFCMVALLVCELISFVVGSGGAMEIFMILLTIGGIVIVISTPEFGLQLINVTMVKP